jgi:hypothetical protein
LRLHGCISACPVVSSTTDLGLNAGGGTFITITDVMFVRAEGKYLWAPGQHSDSSRRTTTGSGGPPSASRSVWTLVP